MKRKLARQILTEWRSNLWLVLELLIISVAVWYIGDKMAVATDISRAPIGLDITNTFRLSTSYSWPGCSSYEESAGADTTLTDSDRYLADMALLEARLSEFPGVVAAGRSSGAPYTYNYSGRMVTPEDNPADNYEQCARPNSWVVTPGFARVFRLRGLNGETPEQLADLLAQGKVLLTENFAGEAGFEGKPSHLVGRRVIDRSDDRHYEVGALVEPQRRNEFEPAGIPYMFMTSGAGYGDLYIRSDGRPDGDFEAAFRQAMPTLRGGNMLVTDITPLSRVRDDFHRTDYADLRDMAICIGFLLLTVFLGLLGTFWFRTQQRAREIAIRKVSGATDGSIFRRLVGEGLLLLCAATLAALPLEYLLESRDIALSASYRPEGWLLWWGAGALAVFLLMAIMITAGIWFPARRAMKVEPAEILRGE